MICRELRANKIARDTVQPDDWDVLFRLPAV